MPLTGVLAKCTAHGSRIYILDHQTQRFRCPEDDCPAFVDLEIVVKHDRPTFPVEEA